jgi:hypothetical protein
MSDYPSTFMKIIKRRANEMSAANDERSQVLNPRVIWDGSVDRFKVLKIMMKVIMEKFKQDPCLTQNFRIHT